MREPRGGITNIIGKGTYITGKIKVEGSIRIDGVIKGNAEITDSIIIGKSGTVHGDIHTKDALIGGKIEGNIFATGKLEFQSGSKLKGDMKCKQLTIEEGVIFDGSCEMSEKASLQKEFVAESLIKPLHGARSDSSERKGRGEPSEKDSKVTK
ncbi:polymer-forming cytoskeletal protein [candidate division WOR-3 bacterium]|nr:polymer-forming cytoskeletal protein [candidate division WOR-3 bacterium]